MTGSSCIGTNMAGTNRDANSKILLMELLWQFQELKTRNDRTPTSGDLCLFLLSRTERTNLQPCFLLHDTTFW